MQHQPPACMVAPDVAVPDVAAPDVAVGATI